MIKYYFFGKECQIDRNLNNQSDLEKNLIQKSLTSLFPTIFVNQTHSNKVVTINKPNQINSLIGARPKADAIITNIKKLNIAVFTADCLPILLFDESRSIIAAIHSGWSGALKDISKNTINKMLEMGANINNIKAIIGPSIRQKSYEVSKEFCDKFLEENTNNKSFFIDSKKNGHFMFNLPQYVKEKLKNQGVKHILDCKIDTYSNPSKFFSYRRSAHLKEKDCGRNISIIQIN